MQSGKLPASSAGPWTSIILRDFLDHAPLRGLFHQIDACALCLGTSQAQVGRDEYEIITHDYALAAAPAMREAKTSLALLFISGIGADSTEKSRALFARVKGRTENDLKLLGFRRLYILRPGIIQAVSGYRHAPLAYRLFKPLHPLVKLAPPSLAITSAELGRVMVRIIKERTPRQVLESRDLRQLITLGHRSNDTRPAVRTFRRGSKLILKSTVRPLYYT
jgi:uncharacterized protein YbjT (DUF2867 family)